MKSLLPNKPDRRGHYCSVGRHLNPNLDLRHIQGQRPGPDPLLTDV
jgi:hypothetical protein